MEIILNKADELTEELYLDIFNIYHEITNPDKKKFNLKSEGTVYIALSVFYKKYYFKLLDGEDCPHYSEELKALLTNLMAVELTADKFNKVYLTIKDDEDEDEEMSMIKLLQQLILDFDEDGNEDFLLEFVKWLNNLDIADVTGFANLILMDKLNFEYDLTKEVKHTYSYEYFEINVDDEELEQFEDIYEIFEYEYSELAKKIEELLPDYCSNVKIEEDNYQVEVTYEIKYFPEITYAQIEGEDFVEYLCEALDDIKYEAIKKLEIAA
jgi:hypothetical protein